MTSASLLPPNATGAERALEAATARLGDVPVPLRSLWDPAVCPADLLPWLGWGVSVDEWNSAWTERQKRAAVAASFRVHRHKGTVEAVRVALGALGYRTTVVEWFEESPAAAPYTFAVDVEVTDQGIGEQTYIDAESIAIAAKNARSHLTRVRAIARTDGTVFVAAAAMGGETVDVRPYYLGEIVARAIAFIAATTLATDTTSIYPEGAHA